MLLKNYFSTTYLFSSAPAANQKMFLVLIGIFVLFIIFATLLGFNRKIHRPLKARLFNFFLTSGILGLLIGFFWYENIPYVGDRIVMLTLIAVIIIWYFDITIYSLTKMQAELRAIKNRERYVKYLPTEKNKRNKNFHR